jgi:hypothetical protein
MMPTADLFVHVDVLVDDALASGVVAMPRRPGPAPACSDAEVLTVALVRHVLGRPSEAGFLAQVRADWAHYFPALPHQSEFNRRARWLWGAFEALRQCLAAAVPADGWQQADTTALPVKHPSRVLRPGQGRGAGRDDRDHGGARHRVGGVRVQGVWRVPGVQEQPERDGRDGQRRHG